MLKSTFFVVAALLWGGGVQAQDFKSPIKLVIPFAAGGAADSVARVMSPKLSQLLGQPVIVENRPGANGQIAAMYVKRAPADGSTFFYGIDQNVLVTPILNPQAGYDALRDFVAVGQVARFQWAFSVPAESPAANLAQYLDLAKRDPGFANYGVPLLGGFPTIVGDALSRKAAVKISPIAFNGSAQVFPQLLGSHIAAAMTGEPDSLALGAKLRILAISGTKRSTFSPQVPTFEEQGVPGLNADSYHLFLAPKGTPQAIAEKFNTALRAVLQDQEVKARLKDMSLEVAPSDLHESARELEKLYRFWNAQPSRKEE